MGVSPLHDVLRSWSRFDVDHWPQGQIYRFLSCLHIRRPLTAVSFDIGIPYFAPGFITIREYVKYIHDPESTLNLNLKVKFIDCTTLLCVQASVFFVLWHSHTLFGMRVYHNGTICRVHSRTLTSKSKLYLHHEFESDKMSELFDIGISNLAYRCITMENMLCTLLTSVWPWPLTYMWVAGGTSSELYSVFILF